MMIQQFMAQAAGADPMISGNWLIAAIGALSTAAAALVGKLKLDQVRRDRTSTRIEGQPLTIAMVDALATKEELKDLEGRLVAELKKLETSLNSERGVARVANGNLHARIDKTVESLAEVRGELTQINANLNRLIDLAVKRTRTT